MENARLLYDAYNIYYEKGTSALLQKNYSVAARNLFSASETLLKLAKVSDGALKEKRFQKADEIYHLAEEVQNKIKSKDEESLFFIFGDCIIHGTGCKCIYCFGN